jgi:hypothetical protein
MNVEISVNFAANSTSEGTAMETWPSSVLKGPGPVWVRRLKNLPFSKHPAIVFK